MNSMKTIIFLAAICLTLQIVSTRVVDAKAVDIIKDAAKELATKTAEDTAAAAAPEVEKKGGIGKKILHTGVDLAIEKGMTVLEAKYPALKVAVPIAKQFAAPVINKAHEKINNMFTKNESTTLAVTDGAETTTPASNESSEDEEGTETESSEASPSSTSGPKSEDASATEAEETSTSKPGLMSKIKKLVKGDSKDKSNGEDESSDAREGIIGSA